MSIFYSKSSKGFYDTSIADYDLPDDCVAISKEQHGMLLYSQSLGKEIVPDENGNPTAVNPENKISIKELAFSELSKSDKTVIRCVSVGVVLPETWVQYRSALRSIVNGTDAISTVLPEKPPYPAGT